MAENGKVVHTCTECGKEFSAPHYLGCEGIESLAHKVAKKTYYSPYNSLTVNWDHGRKYMNKASGVVETIPGRSSRFTGGQRMTTDPSEQDALDKKTHLITRARYEQMRTTPELQAARLRQKVEEQKTLVDKQQAELEELRADKAKREKGPEKTPSPGPPKRPRGRPRAQA